MTNSVTYVFDLVRLSSSFHPRNHRQESIVEEIGICNIDTCEDSLRGNGYCHSVTDWNENKKHVGHTNEQKEKLMRRSSS